MMPNKKLKISVVLAVHNEEKNIVSCLESVSSFADEIIVVDGESTDATALLAKKNGAKVISTTNKVNFHINKQMAMDAATGSLILQLDADEVVTSTLADFIIKVSKQHNQFVEKAWYIKRKNFFLGRFLTKGGQYPDPVIRLYLQGYAQLPQKDVHEQMTVKGAVGTAKGHLLHYANPSFDDYVHKFNRYTTFKAQQLADWQTPLSFFEAVKHCVVKPIATFFSLYFRHKGFVDGIPGLVFAAMSGSHHLIAYLKYWELSVVETQ
jgi:glycosyltransferase involved in cell wall biosynthesis